MQFGNANTYHEAYFDETFGKYGIYHKQEYAGGIYKSDYDYHSKNLERVNKEFAKDIITKVRETDTSEYASGTSYSATTGSLPVLIPIWVSPDIIELSRKETPIYEMLPKVAVRGKFFDWNKMQYATNNAGFKQEDAILVQPEDTYTRSIIQMKYCYAVGRVTGPMQIASRGYIDMERQEIMVKTRQLLQKIENEILNGDTGSDPNGFDGLSKTITTNATAIGGALTLDDVRLHIMYARQGTKTYNVNLGGGNPNLIITNYRTLDQLKALIQTYLHYYGPMTTIAWGIEAIKFEGLPLVASKFMTTADNVKEIYFIDTSVVKLGVSLDITFERLAKTNDSNKFMIKWYGALLVLAEQFCAKMSTLA